MLNSLLLLASSHSQVLGRESFILTTLLEGHLSNGLSV